MKRGKAFQFASFLLLLCFHLVQAAPPEFANELAEGYTVRGAKYLLLTPVGDTLVDESLFPARQAFNARGTPFDEFMTVKNQIAQTPEEMSLELYDPTSGIPLYDGIVMTSHRLTYFNFTEVRTVVGLSDELDDLLKAYEIAEGVRRVSLDGEPLSTFGVNLTHSSATTGTLDSTTIRYAEYAIANETNSDPDRFFMSGMNENLTIETHGSIFYYRPVEVTGEVEVNIVMEFVDDNNETSGIAAIEILYDDSREQLAFFFAQSEYNIGTIALETVWFNWLSRGRYFGSRRLLLSTQIDDWFLSTNTWVPELNGRGNDTYRAGLADTSFHVEFQAALNDRLPDTSNFTIEFAFNGLGAVNSGSSGVESDTLFKISKLYREDFLWLTHTYTHLSLTVNDQATSLCTGCGEECFGLPTRFIEAECEIHENQLIADIFYDNFPCGSDTTGRSPGFSEKCRTYSQQSIVTPRISGLFNEFALSAMYEKGLRNAVSDNSLDVFAHPFAYHGFYTTEEVHGFEGFFLIPRYATSIFFDCSLPEENTAEFNYVFGDAIGRNLTFQEILDRDATLYAQSLLGFQHDPYMFHQANLRVFPYTFPDGVTETTSTLAAWIKTVTDYLYDHFASIPLRTYKQEDMWWLLLERKARDDCGIEPYLIVESNTSVLPKDQRIMGMAWDNPEGKKCRAGVTGPIFSGYASTQSYRGDVEVETYGPDTTAWAHTNKRKRSNTMVPFDFGLRRSMVMSDIYEDKSINSNSKTTVHVYIEHPLSSDFRYDDRDLRDNFTVVLTTAVVATPEEVIDIAYSGVSDLLVENISLVYDSSSLSFEGSFIPPKTLFPRTLYMNILFRGEHIEGSPFEVSIVPGYWAIGLLGVGILGFLSYLFMFGHVLRSAAKAEERMFLEKLKASARGGIHASVQWLYAHWQAAYSAYGYLVAGSSNSGTIPGTKNPWWSRRSSIITDAPVCFDRVNRFSLYLGDGWKDALFPKTSVENIEAPPAAEPTLSATTDASETPLKILRQNDVLIIDPKGVADKRTANELRSRFHGQYLLARVNIRDLAKNWKALEMVEKYLEDPSAAKQTLSEESVASSGAVHIQSSSSIPQSLNGNGNGNGRDSTTGIEERKAAWAAPGTEHREFSESQTQFEKLRDHILGKKYAPTAPHRTRGVSISAEQRDMVSDSTLQVQDMAAEISDATRDDDDDERKPRQKMFVEPHRNLKRSVTKYIHTHPRSTLSRMEKVLEGILKPEGVYDGIVLTGVEDWIIPNWSPNVFVRLMRHIRYKFPSVVLMLEDSLLAFRQVAREINGLLVRNALIDPVSGMRKSYFDTSQERLRTFLQDSSVEQRLRSDFIILDVEGVGEREEGLATSESSAAELTQFRPEVVLSVQKWADLNQVRLTLSSDVEYKRFDCCWTPAEGIGALQLLKDRAVQRCCQVFRSLRELDDIRQVRKNLQQSPMVAAEGDSSGEHLSVSFASSQPSLRDEGSRQLINSALTSLMATEITDQFKTHLPCVYEFLNKPAVGMKTCSYDDDVAAKGDDDLEVSPDQVMSIRRVVHTPLIPVSQPRQRQRRLSNPEIDKVVGNAHAQDMDLWMDVRSEEAKAKCRKGQRPVGCPATASEYEYIVNLQSFLRRGGHLQNFSVDSIMGPFLRGTAQESEPDDNNYPSLLKRLRTVLRVIERRIRTAETVSGTSPKGHYVSSAAQLTEDEQDVLYGELNKAHTDTVDMCGENQDALLDAMGLSELKQLRTAVQILWKQLQARHWSGMYNVQVWLGDRAGFRLHTSSFGKLRNPETAVQSENDMTRFYWSVSERDNDVLHIYVNRAHPNPAEAILHCFFEDLGFSPAKCTILESLGRSRMASHPKYRLVSDRIMSEIDAATYEELCLNVHRTAMMMQWVGKCTSAGEVKQEAPAAADIPGVSPKASVHRANRPGFFATATGKQNSQENIDITSDRTGSMQHLRRIFTQEINDISMDHLLEDVSRRQHLTHQKHVYMKMKQQHLEKRSPDFERMFFGWSSEDIAKVATEAPFQRRFDKDYVQKLHNELKGFLSRYLWQQFDEDGMSSRDALVELPRHLTEFWLLNGHSTRKVDLLYYLFINILRRAAIDELEVAILENNPFPTREPDQMAVHAEMLALGSQCEEFFELTIHELGQILYVRTRDGLKTAPPPDNAFDRSLEDDYERSRLNKIGTRLRQLSHGFAFSMPAIVDLVLILLSGTGAFGTTSLSIDDQEIVGLSILLSFAFLGGLVNAMGRGGSYYLFQWSFPLMMNLFIRLLMAGVFVIFLEVLCGSVILGLIQGFIWANIGLFAIYATLFSSFLLLITPLFILHMDGMPFKYSGRRVLLFASPLLLVPFLLIETFRITSDFSGRTIFWMYIGALGVCFIMLTLGLRRVMVRFMKWADNIKPTSDADVEEWFSERYAHITNPMKQKESGVIDFTEHEYRRAVKRWKYNAREAFVHHVRLQLKKTFWQRLWETLSCGRRAPGYRLDGLIRERGRQYWNELQLIRWYILTRVDRKLPRHASSDWDRLLGFALIEMRKKYTTERESRGGLVFTYCAKEIVNGSLYFILIFLDRWVNLLSGHGVFVFLPTIGKDYGVGIGVATVFYLVVAGTFDLSMVRILGMESEWERRRLQPLEAGVELLATREKEKRKLYWREVKLFALHCFGAFSLASVLMWHVNVGETSVILYLIAIFGYIGMLWGIFNKLFLGGKHALALLCMVSSVIVGLIGGIAIRIFVDDEHFAISGLLLGGWSFGLSSFWAINWSTEKDYSIPAQSYDMSSGQRYVCTASATDASVTSKALQFRVLEHLHNAVLRSDPRILQLSPVGTKRGEVVVSILKSMSEKFSKRFVKSPMLTSAFQHPGELLEETARLWEIGMIVVWLVPEEHLRVNSERGVGFSAISYIDKSGGSSTSADDDGDLEYFLYIYIGVPWNSHMTSAQGEDERCWQIAEAILHETCETLFGMTHQEACVAELLLHGDNDVPSRIMRQLEVSSEDVLKGLELQTEIEIMRKLLLGIDVNSHWEKLPSSARKLLLGFAVGQIPSLSLQEYDTAIRAIEMTLLRHSAERERNPIVWKIQPRHRPSDYREPSSFERRVSVARLGARLAIRIGREAKRTRDLSGGRNEQSQSYFGQNANASRKQAQSVLSKKVSKFANWLQEETKGGGTYYTNKAINHGHALAVFDFGKIQLIPQSLQLGRLMKDVEDDRLNKRALIAVRSRMRETAIESLNTTELDGGEGDDISHDYGISKSAQKRLMEETRKRRRVQQQHGRTASDTNPLRNENTGTGTEEALNSIHSHSAIRLSFSQAIEFFWMTMSRLHYMVLTGDSLAPREISWVLNPPSPALRLNVFARWYLRFILIPLYKYVFRRGSLALIRWFIWEPRKEVYGTLLESIQKGLNRTIYKDSSDNRPVRIEVHDPLNPITGFVVYPQFEERRSRDQLLNGSRASLRSFVNGISQSTLGRSLTSIGSMFGVLRGRSGIRSSERRRLLIRQYPGKLATEPAGKKGIICETEHLDGRMFRKYVYRNGNFDDIESTTFYDHRTTTSGARSGTSLFIPYRARSYKGKRFIDPMTTAAFDESTGASRAPGPLRRAVSIVTDDSGDRYHPGDVPAVSTASVRTVRLAKQQSIPSNIGSSASVQTKTTDSVLDTMYDEYLYDEEGRVYQALLWRKPVGGLDDLNSNDCVDESKYVRICATFYYDPTVNPADAKSLRSVFSSLGRIGSDGDSEPGSASKFASGSSLAMDSSWELEVRHCLIFQGHPTSSEQVSFVKLQHAQLGEFETRYTYPHKSHEPELRTVKVVQTRKRVPEPNDAESSRNPITRAFTRGSTLLEPGMSVSALRHSGSKAGRSLSRLTASRADLNSRSPKPLGSRQISSAALSRASLASGEDQERRKSRKTAAKTKTRRVPSETPKIVAEDVFGLLSLGRQASVYSEDLTSTFSLRMEGMSFWNVFGRMRRRFAHLQRLYTKRYDTTQARTALWRTWHDSGHLPGVFARQVDELLLRDDNRLAPYWGFRDSADTYSAQEYLRTREPLIAQSLFMPQGPDTRSHLLIRMADLDAMASGGDAHVNTNLIEQAHSMLESSTSSVSVLGLDSGTWPVVGGGVGACRRDVVNGIKTARWTMISETGTDNEMIESGYQVERNVQSLTFVPLWGGADFRSPAQTVLSHLPYSEVTVRQIRTTNAVVEKQFVPMLIALIRGCVRESFTMDELDMYSDLLVHMYLYFQKHDWLRTWDNPNVRRAFVLEWLAHQRNLSIGAEQPCLDDILLGMGIFVRLLFALSVPLPESMPIIHSSHHGIQAWLGVVSKKLYGSFFVVWDHGILWRERMFSLSVRDSTFSPFVLNALAGLTRLAACVNYHCADLVVPCTSQFNPLWEQEIGGRRITDSTQSHVLKFARKISPITNGIDVNRFVSNREMETEKPTVVMLSNVLKIKDVENAIWSAHYVVNHFQIKDYELRIYGNTEKDPWYASQCAELIEAKNLQNNVFLMGTGNAQKVLQEGWAFMNSSRSEGLPLAIAEAGLCGLPVICTDVGGSKEILSESDDESLYELLYAAELLMKDRQTAEAKASAAANAPSGISASSMSQWSRDAEKDQRSTALTSLLDRPRRVFGALVPPNNPFRLAMAQLEVLGLLGDLEKLVDQAYGTEDNVHHTAEDSMDVRMPMKLSTIARAKKSMTSKLSIMESTTSVAAYESTSNRISKRSSRFAREWSVRSIGSLASGASNPSSRSSVVTAETEDAPHPAKHHNLHVTDLTPQQLTERMYAMRNKRQLLGDLLRERCKRLFSAERYLREHEQVLWVGRFQFQPWRLPSHSRQGNKKVWDTLIQFVSKSRTRPNLSTSAEPAHEAVSGLTTDTSSSSPTASPSTRVRKMAAQKSWRFVLRSLFGSSTMVRKALEQSERFEEETAELQEREQRRKEVGMIFGSEIERDKGNKGNLSDSEASSPGKSVPPPSVVVSSDEQDAGGSMRNTNVLAARAAMAARGALQRARNRLIQEDLVAPPQPRANALSKRPSGVKIETGTFSPHRSPLGRRSMSTTAAIETPLPPAVVIDMHDEDNEDDSIRSPSSPASEGAMSASIGTAGDSPKSPEVAEVVVNQDDSSEVEDTHTLEGSFDDDAYSGSTHSSDELDSGSSDDDSDDDSVSDDEMQMDKIDFRDRRTSIIFANYMPEPHPVDETTKAAVSISITEEDDNTSAVEPGRSFPVYKLKNMVARDSSASASGSSVGKGSRGPAWRRIFARLMQPSKLSRSSLQAPSESRLAVGSQSSIASSQTRSVSNVQVQFAGGNFSDYSDYGGSTSAISSSASLAKIVPVTTSGLLETSGISGNRAERSESLGAGDIQTGISDYSDPYDETIVEIGPHE